MQPFDRAMCCNSNGQYSGKKMVWMEGSSSSRQEARLGTSADAICNAGSRRDKVL